MRMSRKGMARLCRSVAVEHLSVGAMVAAMLSTLAGLALVAGVARAETPRLVSYGTFSTDGGLGVAVDQSGGDVFTAGFFAYNAKNEFTGLGSNQQFDAAGTPISQSFGEGAHYGIAVNPINGHLYIANALTNEIEVDEANGTPVPSSPSFAVPEFGELRIVAPAQIATDSEGHVYVPSAPNNEVVEYSENGTPLHTFTGLDEPTGIAVAGSGDLWIADRGANRIEELSPAGKVEDEIASEGVAGVALNAQGDVLALVDNSADFCGSLAPPCEHLVEYSPAGAQLADIGAGEFGSASGEAPLFNMLAVDESSGRVYVADDNGQNLVWIFGPPSAPRIESELAVEVGASEAKLGALVNPGGVETKYRFEYDTREYHEGESSHGVSVPFPEGSAGQGVTARTVWATAGGLAPGTTYHYRVVATNVAGTAVGADRTFTTGAQVACPNEPLRGGFSANLPDCRAYELVTASSAAATESESAIAARDGNRVQYDMIDVLPESESAGLSYLATRGAGGWSSEDAIPRLSYTALYCSLVNGGTVAVSSDLSKLVFFDGEEGRASAPGEGGKGGGGCNAEDVEVVPGEPQGYKNLLLRNNESGAYELINVTPPGVTPADAHFQGASSDLAHIVFAEHAKLTAEAPAGVEDLYEWHEGALRLVTVLPDGTSVAGTLAGTNETARAHAVSADGSRVFFTAGGDLYARINGESTVQLDRPQGGSGPGGGGSFWDASADGLRVFFTDEASAGLTSNTAPGSGENLYEYDFETGQLQDLTSEAHAEVMDVAGASEDGSDVYFVAGGVLADNENANKEKAQPGEGNLYSDDNGMVSFIATLEHGDKKVGEEGQVRVSANGAYVAFVSDEGLTGYDNDGSNEIFLYSAAVKQLVCASCNPSGEPATRLGPTMERESTSKDQHYLSNAGQVFFDTEEALLPSDTNDQADVYEYEDGQLHLVSTGTSSSGSTFLDASENGEDVFFDTRQSLLAQDTDEEARVIYDARVDGGFPEPTTPPACTTAETCHAAPAPQPSIYGAPASQTFSGLGNLAPAAKVKSKAKSKPAKCAKRFVKRQGRCVKRTKRTKRSDHTRHKVAGKSARSRKAGR
jgi:hypothetical protein